jgi:hypothetical protein
VSSVCSSSPNMPRRKPPLVDKHHRRAPTVAPRHLVAYQGLPDGHVDDQTLVENEGHHVGEAARASAGSTFYIPSTAAALRCHRHRSSPPTDRASSRSPSAVSSSSAYPPGYSLRRSLRHTLDEQSKMVLPGFPQGVGGQCPGPPRSSRCSAIATSLPTRAGRPARPVAACRWRIKRTIASASTRCSPRPCDAPHVRPASARWEVGWR